MCQHVLRPGDTRVLAARKCAHMRLQGRVLHSEQHLLTKVHIQGLRLLQRCPREPHTPAANG